MPEFEVGDRVVAAAPVNENWNGSMTATVTGAFPEVRRMHIRWDHGAVNYSVDMDDFVERDYSDGRV